MITLVALAVVWASPFILVIFLFDVVCAKIDEAFVTPQDAEEKEMYRILDGEDIMDRGDDV